MRFVFIFILFIPVTSFARDADPVHRICDEISKSSARQSADYVPGVDVHGKAVASADLNASTLGALNSVSIPIELDLAQAFGLNFPAGIELNPIVASLQIFQDGRVVYNDVDLTQKVQNFCVKHPKEPIVETQKQDGQQSFDPVGSSDKIEGAFPAHKSE